MKRLFLIFGIFFSLIQNVQALSEEDKDLVNRFITFTGTYEENLQRVKQKPLVDLTEEEKEAAADFSIERKINPEYIAEYEKAFQVKYTPRAPINPWWAVHYDPEYFIEYLEKIPARTLEQKYQLLVLWQIYKPEKVHSEEYKAIAAAAHAKTMEYLSNDDNWQASWRRDEYNEIVQNDFQECYANQACLLKAIPYWMDLRISMNVILPCDVAKANNLVYYIDAAAGGSGTRTIVISSCEVDKKYDIAPELDDYINSVIWEKTPYSAGTMVNVFYAAADALYGDIKYQPQFDDEEVADWREFPYTEWAVQSYYNFNKFNSVLETGIGIQKAVESLKDHYIKVFGFEPKKALKAALKVFNPPSSSHFERIKPDNINYLLLTGAPWEKIQKQLPQNADIAKLLELSIAHPQNLQQLVKLVKNVDEQNSFGKTPLQTAAQYGYLESVKILLSAGADINHQTNKSECWSERDLECIHNGKRTALMYALQENHYDVAQYLLDNGADITLADSLENTALDYLAKRAPIFSTHERGSIYGGTAKPKVAEDDEKLPLQQYKQLYKRLFFNQQPQISKLLEGKWKTNKSEFTFKTGTNPDEPLLTVWEMGEITMECEMQKDDQKVFSCVFDSLDGIEKKVDIYFAISHYYNDKAIMYYGFKSKKLSECLQEKSCHPDILRVLER